MFAGDMFEVLTNGHTKALKHRVALPGSSSGSPGPIEERGIVRQSHILFLQPDNDTTVAPLNAFLRHDGTDYQAVRYGSWHRKKVDLAFGLVAGKNSNASNAASALGPELCTA